MTEQRKCQGWNPGESSNPLEDVEEGIRQVLRTAVGQAGGRRDAGKYVWVPECAFVGFDPSGMGEFRKGSERGCISNYEHASAEDLRSEEKSPRHGNREGSECQTLS
jgi:hypothetical protein